MTVCVMSPACAAAVAAGAPHASRTQHRRLFAQRTVGTQLSTKSFTTKTRRRAVVSASAAEDDDAADQDSATAGEAGDMLRMHVAFLATRRGSRFAAQELAIVATEAYERGLSVASLRMDISLLGLSTQNRMGLSEQDAFLSNIGMCMMTLYELGWPSPGGGEGWCPVGDGGAEDKEAKGLLSYIRQTHAKSDEGYTLKRMEMERLMALQGRGSEEGIKEGLRTTTDPLTVGVGSRGGQSGGESGAMRESPAIMLMRVNCRLTLLLREMVFIARGLRPVSEVVSSVDAEEEAAAMRAAAAAEVAANDDAVDDGEGEEKGEGQEDEEAKKETMTGAAARAALEEALEEEEESPQVALEWCRRERTPTRDSSARLLTAYFSSLTTHPVGLRGFAAAALDAYSMGIPAADLTRAVLPTEFDVEGSRRGMFGSSADATKFFALFVTTAYVCAEEEGLLPGFTKGRAAVTAAAAVAVACDPDMFAWAPAPGETDTEEGTETETGTEEAGTGEALKALEDARRRSVAGMRGSVCAWMDMNRAALEAQVYKQLSVDEDDDVSASMDEMDEVMDDALTQQGQDASDRVAGVPMGGVGNRVGAPPGGSDLPFVRDDFLADTSITIAALTIQRMVVSFVLQEIGARGGGDSNFSSVIKPDNK